jgi:hypothetical protein
MSAYPFYLTAANVYARQEIEATKIGVIDAVGDLTIEVQGDEGQRTFVLGQGGSVNLGVRFKTVAVKAAAAQTVLLEIGRDEIVIPRKKVQAELVPADQITDFAHAGTNLAAGATVTVAADATRKILYVNNPAANSFAVHVGAVPGAATGLPIPPGVTMGIAAACEVRVYNPAGVTQQIYLMTMQDI